MGEETNDDTENTSEAPPWAEDNPAADTVIGPLPVPCIWVVGGHPDDRKAALTAQVCASSESVGDDYYGEENSCEKLFGDDWYANNPDWAEDAPDIREELETGLGSGRDVAGLGREVERTRSRIDADLRSRSRDIRDPHKPPSVLKSDSEAKPWDVSRCECTIPELEVQRGEVGSYEFQILRCKECQMIFGFIADLIDGTEDSE